MDTAHQLLMAKLRQGSGTKADNEQLIRSSVQLILAGTQPLLKRLDRPTMGRQHPEPSAGQCQELDRQLLGFSRLGTRKRVAELVADIG